MQVVQDLKGTPLKGTPLTPAYWGPKNLNKPRSEKTPISPGLKKPQ